MAEPLFGSFLLRLFLVYFIERKKLGFSRLGRLQRAYKREVDMASQLGPGPEPHDSAGPRIHGSRGPAAFPPQGKPWVRT